MNQTKCPEIARLLRRLSRLEDVAGNAIHDLEASQLAMQMALEDFFECTNGAFEATRKTAEALSTLRRILLQLPEFRDSLHSLSNGDARQHVENQENKVGKTQLGRDSELPGAI